MAGLQNEEFTLPGIWHDVGSAAHPLAVASPPLRRFSLGARGPVRIPGGGVRAPVGWGPAAAVTRSAVTRGSYRRLVQPLVAGGTAVTDLLLSAMRRPQGRYFPGLAVLARQRPGATVRLPGVRALVAGAPAHAMMPLNVPPAGGVGLRRVSGSVSAGEQITYPGAARTASQTAGTCAQIGSARGRRQAPPRSVICRLRPRGTLKT